MLELSHCAGFHRRTTAAAALTKSRQNIVNNASLSCTHTMSSQGLCRMNFQIRPRSRFLAPMRAAAADFECVITLWHEHLHSVYLKPGSEYPYLLQIKFVVGAKYVIVTCARLCSIIQAVCRLQVKPARGRGLFSDMKGTTEHGRKYLCTALFSMVYGVQFNVYICLSTKRYTLL